MWRNHTDDTPITAWTSNSNTTCPEHANDACSGTLILMNNINLLGSRCSESIASIHSYAGSAIHHIKLSWSQLEEPDQQLPIQSKAWFRRWSEYECMLNWRLVQVWKLEETITQGHVQSILPLLVLHCMQNFDLVDIGITCAILGSFLCRSHKSGWNSNHSWAVHELFECVKLLRWRMGARLVTLRRV